MPHRLLDHPVQAFFAFVGVLTSFMASLSRSVDATARKTQTLFATVDDTTLLSWAGTGVAVLAFVAPACIKWYKEGRQASLDSDTAEVDTWSGVIRSEVVKRSEFEGENAFLKKRVADLESQLAKVQRTVNKVGSIAVETRDKTAEQDERLAAVEHVTGSTSGMDFPASPPVEPKPE